MSKIAIVQLARSGDIVNALPIAYALALAGDEVHWYVCQQFAPILEPVSYVTVHAMDLGHREVARAAAVAKADGYDRILIPQVDGNESPYPQKCDNFTLQQWANAGPEWLDRYHEFRPLFDRRDRRAEVEQCANALPADDGRPLLLLNLKSHSSPYHSADSFKRWVELTLGAGYRIFDLSELKLPQPHLLLGFLDLAAAIITVDTLTLHLAAATGTPTVQLSAGVTPTGRPSAWYDSEPRAQVVYKCSYANSHTPATQAAIAKTLLTRDFRPGKWIRGVSDTAGLPINGDKIRHVTDWYLGNVKDNPRILRARATWEELRAVDPNYQIVEHVLNPHHQRSSADLGDSRTLPYIRDIIDAAAAANDKRVVLCQFDGPACHPLRRYGPATDGDEDIIVFSNSDVSLVPEALNEIRRKLMEGPCCYSRRVDVEHNGPRRTLRDQRSVHVHVGADLFAMRQSFWLSHRDELPNVFLSCEGWDAVARWWMKQHRPDAEMNPPIIYHQSHVSFWAQDDVVRSNPAQIHNRLACEKWAKENGAAAALYSAGEKYLFRPDSEWSGKGKAVA